MLSWVFGKKRGEGKRKAPAYDRAKQIAEKGSVKERTKLASYDNLEPEFLYFFATDEAPEVRRAVARNDGTPLQADVVLAKDTDLQVRQELAHKIGRIIPTLTETENERLTEMAMQVLDILARDNEAQVRAVIADEIKLLTNVPKRVVQRLARDVEDVVAMPILEYSPLLTQQELTQIIASGVTGGALEAIARRKGVDADVAEAIVATGDRPAVGALLENETARIGEKTMDVIATAAPDAPEWHSALVDRSNLSEHTLRRIATFVSAALFERLIGQRDLPADVEADLRRSVPRRIEAGDMPDPDQIQREPADERAQKMYKKGELTEARLQTAIEDTDTALIPHALVLLSGIPLDRVKAILRSDNGKAVTALVWKAGLVMPTAMMVQRRVAKVQPRNMLHDSMDGKFPVPKHELESFLEIFV